MNAEAEIQIFNRIYQTALVHYLQNCSFLETWILPCSDTLISFLWLFNSKVYISGKSDCYYPILSHLLRKYNKLTQSKPAVSCFPKKNLNPIMEFWIDKLVNYMHSDTTKTRYIELRKIINKYWRKNDERGIGSIATND